jgi:hypothetical protein
MNSNCISSIQNVYKSIEIKNNKKKEIYKVLVNKCSKFIEKNVCINNLSCFYQVPEFLIGYPIYSLEESISYVQKELIDSGFIVLYFFPNVLYISWNPLEVNNNVLNSKDNIKQIENDNDTVKDNIKDNKKIVKKKVIKKKENDSTLIQSTIKCKQGGKFFLNL